MTSDPGGLPISVLIVEDHQVLAEGLELALGRQPDLAVTGIAGTVAEACRLARDHRPSVVLMDFHLPDGTGAEAAARIRAEAAEVAVVFLTADSSEEAMVAAVEVGASGFLVKSEAAARVVESVRRAAEGEMLIPAATLAALLARQREMRREASHVRRVVSHLTPRELEVLRLMARGLDNRAIADQLVISFTTVRGHVQSILEKLDAHSKLEAVARAGRLGLLDR